MSRIVGSICGCARQRVGVAGRSSCFRQFAGEVEELVKLQVRLHGLHKQDMDDEARLSSPAGATAAVSAWIMISCQMKE